MATIKQHIAATRDADLRTRVIAAAERAGIDAPSHWTDANLGKIVDANIGDTTLADVHAYAVASYQPTPRPGEDDTKITDAQVEAAVANVNGGTP